MRASCIAVAAVLAVLSAAPAAAQGLLGRWTGPRAARALRSDDPTVRIDAAEELARWGDPRHAVVNLAAALEAERDVAVRTAIVQALARRGDPAAVPALVSALETTENLDSIAVVLALGSFDDDRAVRALVAALGRDDVAEAAGRALERSGARAVPHLIRALGEPALATRAMHVLGRLGDRRATAPLVARLSADQEEVRLSAVRALGALGDRRAAPALVALLDDPSAEVVLDALRALGRTGEPGQTNAVLARVADGPPEHRRAALAAAMALDPEAAAPFMERAVASGDRVLARPAIELALASRHPRMIPLLFGLLREGSRRDEAAGALAEVEAGAGIPVLVRALSEDPDAAWDASRALAIGLRKHRDALDHATYERALAALARARMPRARSLILRAVAFDATIEPELVRALRSDDAAERATAARAIELLGDAELAGPVADALAREEDAEAFRRLAAAAALLGARVPYSAVRKKLSSPDTGPEAMVAAARSIESYGQRRSDELRSALREALRAEHPRLRVGAARALSVAGDRAAFRALVTTLDDPAPEVRLAAARALAELAVPSASADIEARWRVEEDAQVARALADAARAYEARPTPPPELGPLGGESVRVRIVAVGEEGRSGVPVDVVLEDGRWLRMRTLPSGELLVVGLPFGVADVRVGVGE